MAILQPTLEQVEPEEWSISNREPNRSQLRWSPKEQDHADLQIEIN